MVGISLGQKRPTLDKRRRHFSPTLRPAKTISQPQLSKLDNFYDRMDLVAFKSELIAYQHLNLMFLGGF
jgi:hypothetical protein